jgi:hypothetical protein
MHRLFTVFWAFIKDIVLYYPPQYFYDTENDKE